MMRKSRRTFDVDRAKELYDEGKTDSEIGEELKVSSVAIGNWRRSMSLESHFMQARMKKKEHKISHIAECVKEQRERGILTYGQFISERDKHIRSKEYEDVKEVMMG